jgi:hypothetical protein
VIELAHNTVGRADGNRKQRGCRALTSNTLGGKRSELEN